MRELQQDGLPRGEGGRRQGGLAQGLLRVRLLCQEAQPALVPPRPDHQQAFLSRAPASGGSRVPSIARVEAHTSRAGCGLTCWGRTCYGRTRFTRTCCAFSSGRHPDTRRVAIGAEAHIREAHHELRRRRREVRHVQQDGLRCGADTGAGPHLPQGLLPLHRVQVGTLNSNPSPNPNPNLTPNPNTNPSPSPSPSPSPNPNRVQDAAGRQQLVHRQRRPAVLQAPLHAAAQGGR